MFKNTDRVRRSAISFIETGHYTSALPGTKDYYDFWDEENLSLAAMLLVGLALVMSHFTPWDS